MYFTPETENMISSKIGSSYHNADEVIREAMELLAYRDEIQKLYISELNRDIKLGLDQIAEGKIISAEESERRMDKLKEKYV